MNISISSFPEPHRRFFSAFISGALSALILLSLGIGGWVRRELLKPVFQTAGLFRIEKGETLSDVALALQKEGIIDNPILLIWYGGFTGRDRLIKSGVYQIPPSLRFKELLALFEKGSNIHASVALPPGIKLQDALIRIKGAGLTINEELFFEPPRKLTSSYRFLQDLPALASFEGFLFPDTYRFDYDASTEGIISTFLDNFNAKFNPEWYEVIEVQGHRVYETIIMASILEKEVPTLKEKKLVSGILWKRLSLGMPLQIDATVNYATGKSLPAVTLADIMVDSPYNTYKYQGLPLGPITSPGIQSLEAAVFPESSTYWFYLSRQDTGETIFSKTFREHRIAKARYLR